MRLLKIANANTLLDLLDKYEVLRNWQVLPKSFETLAVSSFKDNFVKYFTHRFSGDSVKKLIAKAQTFKELRDALSHGILQK
jgi:hypothetical protein